VIAERRQIDVARTCASLGPSAREPRRAPGWKTGKLNCFPLIAYQNKGVIYELLFKASAETKLTIAADPNLRSIRRAPPRSRQ
jgi:hypothetical protein